ncbi:substrate-binding domain-containing protein [Sphingomonas sp. AR_OL41]|uniref:LacI family DNA-binding transcriptional regulator n=1 Tax=Sphingomonas sp. AR_OL41 TaxID=3042729 RepID=UPI002481590C|nr:substrate-binding domain-containing protein [Sphingomonas sp. AR_OL41]MDH7973316.1 substrate-binding domain-containing protein [Sphingomonas sp. AR_OL41]
MDPAGGKDTAPPTRQATSHDVAALAGVSQPTVSRALRDSPTIARATRDRVKAAAAALDYRPHRAAMQLRGARPGCIALVLLSAPGADRATLNPFYYELVGAVEAAAARRQLSVSLSFQGERATWRCDFQQRGEADGVIVIGSAANRAAWRFFGEAHAAGGNIVGWGAPDDALPTIRADNHAGAVLAVDHLVAQGRQRIAFVGPGWRRHHAFRARRDGWRAALSRHGLDAIEGDAPIAGSRIDQGAAAIDGLLARGAAYDAVFAASDGLALGVMRRLSTAGRAVPGDVAVIGFDGSYHARDSQPALSTIEQDLVRAGALLVDAIMDGLTVADAVAMPVPVRLVTRASG